MTVNGISFEHQTLKRSCDVVIVGAGVVGLFTALLLKKQGVNVQIYERQPGMYPLPKAISLSDEMVRHFHLNGFSDLVDDHVLGAGTQSDNPHFKWTDANKNVLSKFRNRASGSSGHSAMSVFHQPNFEAYFNLQCEAHNIPLYRRWNFVNSKQQVGSDGNDMVIHFERNVNGLKNVYNTSVDVSCKWLIGCDGANSTVRQYAGLKQQDLAFQYDWLVVDLLPNKDVPQEMTWTQVCDPARPTTVIGESTNGRRRLEFMRLDSESIEDLSSPQVVWKLLEKYHMNPTNTEIERAAVYRFQALNTLDYWDGNRTLIAGDAAHLSPPFIGQGLNSGFRDAIGVSWRLSRVLKGQSSPKIMHSYSLERRKHTQHLIDIATGHGDLICELNPEKAEVLHSAMRKRYIANGEKEEPFLESLLHSDGCLLSNRNSGAIFINRRVLPFIGAKPEDARLFDNVFSVTKGWRLFKLAKTGQEKEATIEESDVMKQLSFLEPSFISISEEQDFEQEYRSFLSQENSLVLIRPDYYVFGMFKDAQDLSSHVAFIRERVAAS